LRKQKARYSRASLDTETRKVKLTCEPIDQSLLHYLAADFSNRTGQRDVFGAHLHAVLSVAALVDSTVAHQRVQAVRLKRFAGRMGVEQAHLRNDRRADKPGLFVELRARLHATGTCDAPGQRIGLLLFLGRK